MSSFDPQSYLLLFLNSIHCLPSVAFQIPCNLLSVILLEAEFSSLDSFIETSRIYFSPEICTLLDALMKDVRTAVVNVHVYQGLDTDRYPASIPETLDAFRTAAESFRNTMPVTRKAIEDEFRKILGVASSGN